MPIEWRDKMSVGDAMVDDDHRNLIRLINQYEDAIGRRDARLLRQTFRGLSDYAEAHFEREEKLMEAVYFPMRRTHGDIHKNLMRQVTDFHFQIVGGERISVAEASRFLHDWFVNHVLQEDMKLRDHLLGRRTT